MPRNYMEEAFAPIEAVNREIMNRKTWGHLAPEVGKKYIGHILFCYTEYDETTIIESVFESLEGSPWFSEDMLEYVVQLTDDMVVGVYRFDGTYIKFKNMNYRFTGSIAKINTGAIIV